MKRVQAFFLAVLMVITTVLGVNVGNVIEVKAEGETTVIIHYQREDKAYDNWNVWAWEDSKEGQEKKFEYDDDFGKVCVIKTTNKVEKMGFIIRKGEWEEKDWGEDQFIDVANGFAEVWVTSGKEGYVTTAPEGAKPFDVGETGGNDGGNANEPSAPVEGQIQVNLHYHRFDENYSGWNVWFWPKGGDGKAVQFTGEDDYGKVATYNVDASAKELGFIVRLNDWEAKDVDADRFIDLSKAKDGVLDVYLIQSDANIYTDKDGADLSPKILSAILVTAKRISMKVTVPVNTDATESMSIFKVKDQDGNEYKLQNLYCEGGTSSDFFMNLETPLDLSKTYTVVSEQYGEKALSYGGVYNTQEFADAFYYEGDDLGATYSKDKTIFKVWTPFASEVKLNLYKEGLGGDAYDVVTMTKGEKGVWSAEVSGDCNGIYYTYSVTNSGVTNEVVDLYARTTGANGKRAMVIDLKSTNPDGWDKVKRPSLVNATDAMVYEMHVRDFTIDKSSGVKNAGKYLGLTEKGTKNSAGLPTALDHILDLGVTHVQLMPVYDYSPNSVDETKLDTPQFNWGYDPYNYNVPEGSYSTDPYKGEVRVNEFKQMIQSFHKNDVRVIMDVVYNHTAESANSWMNLTVPGYYYRMNDDGSFSNGSGCGNEVASERAMVRKYIVDSVVYWATEYKVDGFRFDLMGLIDIETMKAIREALDKVDPTIIIYGEGWTGGTSLLLGYDAALKKNTIRFEDKQIGAFSDDIRDGLKGSVFTNTDTGFATGKIGQEERIKAGVIGATNYPGINWAGTHTDICSPWAANPIQTVNYTSCHDNLTLWDKIALSNKDDSEEDRIKMNLLCASVVYTSQGIPFILSGEEILRSKGGDHNSYKSSDEVNSIKWDDMNTEVYEYYKGLIEFRKNHAGLRMTKTDDVATYLKFIADAPANVVAYTIDGKANGECADQLLVIYNANKEAVEVNIPSGEWKVCVKDNKAGTDVIETISGGKASVSAISTMVLVKGDTVDPAMSGSDFPLVPVIIISAVAVVAIIAAVVILKGRKKKVS